MLLTTNHGEVRELRLNHPPANALSPELVSDLTQAVAVAPREGVRALVLSGSPGMFSAGLDVPYLLKQDRAGIADLWRRFYGLLGTLASSEVPIAAAITGHAPAGGTVLTLFCDWRVMAQGDWKLGLNEVQVGLRVPPVILAALRRQVGPRQAERLAATGPMLTPGEALSAGLVDELAPAEQVVERALDWCRNIVALPREAMSATRRSARADLVALFQHGHELELDEVLANWWGAEAQSTLRGLVERLAKKKAQ